MALAMPSGCCPVLSRFPKNTKHPEISARFVEFCSETYPLHVLKPCTYSPTNKIALAPTDAQDLTPAAPQPQQNEKPAATKISGKEILDAIQLMDADERRELTRALFA